MNSVSVTGFPLGLTTSRPGQWNLTVALSSSFFTAVIWQTTNTAMMIA